MCARAPVLMPFMSWILVLLVCSNLGLADTFRKQVRVPQGLPMARCSHACLSWNASQISKNALIHCLHFINEVSRMPLKGRECICLLQ